MRNSIGKLAGIIIALTLTSITSVEAADVGGPAIPAKTDNIGINIIYERYKRDVKLSSRECVIRMLGDEITLPASSESGVQDEVRLMARLSFPVGSRALIHLDGGVTDSEASQDVDPILGGGFRVLAYQSDAIDVSIFGSAHYVPKIEYEFYFTNIDLNTLTFNQEESYWEANGGVVLSHPVALESGPELTLYGGLMISVLEGDEDWEIQFSDVGEVGEREGQLEDDGAVSVLGGLACQFNEQVGMRVEGRFVNQTSLSVAVVVNL